MSALPLGVNQIKIQRGLTTSALAIMMPFTTQEIFQGGDALYYGLNATSGNMILADRKQNKTPNGLILGTPGSGKSFSATPEPCTCRTKPCSSSSSTGTIVCSSVLKMATAGGKPVMCSSGTMDPP